jgi:hypothetical protein
MMDFKNIILFVLLSLVSGCVNGIDYVVHGSTEIETEVRYITIEPDPDIWIDSFTQIASYEDIDILWVLDGSCSMFAHESSILRGIEQMMNVMPSDVNWRLKMITGGGTSYITQPTTFPLTRGDDINDALNMYNQLPSDGRERGFDAVYNYITSDTYAQTWMRKSAALLVMFVSDEKEQSMMTAAEFVIWYDFLRAEKFLSFIGNVYPEDTVCPYVPHAAMIGVKYMDAVNYFSGTIVDICELDWASGVNDVAQKMEPIKEIELTHIPYKDTIVVFINGEKIENLEWTYNALSNAVEFNSYPEEAALVEVGYSIHYYSLTP